MRRWVWAVLAVVVLGGAPFVGPALEGPAGSFILWRLRVPRVIVGAQVGAVLGLVGAVFQVIFGNPLATPSTVGTLAGATLGVLVALVFGLGAASDALPLLVGFGFAGALLTSLLVVSVAASGRARLEDILLAGIAVTLATGALSTGLQYGADMPALFTANRWSLGHLSQLGYRGAVFILPFALLTAVVLHSQRRALESMLVGDELAATQGVNVRRLRFVALGIGSLGVAACVAWCGPIAFVCLIVPHLVRKLVGTSVRALLPMSLLFGAGFLVTCDTLARVILPGAELPVGVLTAGLGAPWLVFLVSRTHK